MSSRLIIPARLPRSRIPVVQDPHQESPSLLGDSIFDTDVMDAAGVEGIRAPPVSPMSNRLEELTSSSSSEQFNTPDEVAVPPKQTSRISNFWSIIAAYARRVVSAACPQSCRPGSGIELTRSGMVGRPAHVCVAEVAVDVDVILTVRSWWPSDLSIEEVREHGLNQAHASARQWWNEHYVEFVNQRRALQEQQQPKHFIVPTDVDVVKRDLLPLVVRFEGDDDEDDSGTWSTPRSQALDMECAICLESNSDCRLRTCQHGFHHECLTKWFCKSRKLCCPLCRSSLDSFIPEHIQHKASAIVEEEVMQPEVITLRVEEGVIEPNDSEASSSPVNGFL